MDWSAEQIGHAYVIRLSGEFDESAAQRFRDQIDAILATGSVRALVVVMKDVSFIDSSGLGALLGRYRRLQALGGTMAAVAPPPHIRSLLELSGVPKVIPVYRTEKQALTSVKEGQA